jgi:hypothetical protein
VNLKKIRCSFRIQDIHPSHSSSSPHPPAYHRQFAQGSNVRGINDVGKRVSINNFLKSWKPDVVCLQEIKMESIIVGIIRSLWGGPFTGWVALPASKASGGILLIWDKRVVECLEVAVGSFSLSYKFKLVWDQFISDFLGVYDPNNEFLFFIFYFFHGTG